MEKELKIKDINLYEIDIEKYIDWTINIYEKLSTLNKAYELIEQSNKIKENSIEYEKLQDELLPYWEVLEYIRYFDIEDKEYQSLISLQPTKADFPETCPIIKPILDTELKVKYFNRYEELKRLFEVKYKFNQKPIELFLKEYQNNLLFTHEKYLADLMNWTLFNRLNIENEGGWNWCLCFYDAMAHIKLIQYIETIITGKEVKVLFISTIKWNAHKNDLITLFKALKESGIIEGTNADISRMIRYVFEDKDGEKFKENYIRDVFKPNKNKESKPILEVLPELIQVLQKNAKK